MYVCMREKKMKRNVCVVWALFWGIQKEMIALLFVTT